MFLSRLRLRPHASEAPEFWRTFSNPYHVHQEVWDLFADHEDRDRDFLFRVDLDAGRPRIFTLSERQPKDRKRIWRVETKEFDPQLREGDALEILTRVNPTIRRDGKRHDVVMDAKHRGHDSDRAEIVQQALTRWLSKRGPRGGFEPSRIWAEGHRVAEFSKPNGRPIRLALADLRGTVEVLDPEAFRSLLFGGLGPAKAFGCGLVLIRRP